MPLLLALTLALLAPAPAGAQGIGHGMTSGQRPFHERIAAVDLAAVVRVERVDEGRIDVRSEDTLLGTLPERFQVKRSPLAPPPLATGDRALLLLRGARPPYVLADRPYEVIRLEGDDMAARWSGAVRAALAARGEPARLVALYGDWVEGGPATLREIGETSLLDLSLRHPELRAEIQHVLARRPAPEGTRRNE